MRAIAVVLLSSVVSSICAAAALAAETGLAAIYGGGRTASGEVAKATALTAAHRTLAFGTMVQVTNRRNGRTVTVRINDRGPFTRGRIIDLTPAAAGRLGFSSGTAPVDLHILEAAVAGVE